MSSAPARPRGVNAAPTNVATDDLEPEYDFSGAARRNVLQGRNVDIVIDGAVGYRLRSLPDGATLGEFDTSRAGMSAALELVGRGRSVRTLALDWFRADGHHGLLFGGARLEHVSHWVLDRPAAESSAVACP